MPDEQVLASTELRDQTERRPSVISDEPIHPRYPVTANVTVNVTANLTVQVTALVTIVRQEQLPVQVQVQRSTLDDHTVHRLKIFLNEDRILAAGCSRVCQHPFQQRFSYGLPHMFFLSLQ